MKKKPTQLSILESVIDEQRKQIQAQFDELKAARLQIDKLQQQLEQLLRVLYGKKSERSKKEPSKDNEHQQTSPPKQNTSQSANKGTKPSRNPFPEHLAREKIKYELSEQERICEHCGTLAHVMGKCVTEQLEYVPARLYVKEHTRYKYVCKFKCGVKIAPMPPQAIDKSIAGPGVHADVLVSKYCDGMPLYRQALRFKRHGIEIAESTLCDWVAQCAWRLEPIVELMKADILSQTRLFTDDTPIPVLAKGKTKQARLWVYVAQSQTGLSATVFDYSATRAKTHPKRFLHGYRGYLQADAYPGYDDLYETKQIIEVGCLAHVRRKFFDIAQAVKSDSLAHHAIEKIAKIYRVEKHMKERGFTYLKRYYYRKKHLKPLYQQMHRWLIKKQKKTILKTPIHKAIQYALNHWQALQNVLSDGRLEVDNNTAERAIKQVVIGRKNYLFAGSDEGGKRAAIIYSLMQTCRQNDINPYEYLVDVLTRLPTIKNSQLHHLLPYHCVQSV